MAERRRSAGLLGCLTISNGSPRKLGCNFLFVALSDGRVKCGMSQLLPRSDCGSDKAGCRLMSSVVDAGIVHLATFRGCLQTKLPDGCFLMWPRLISSSLIRCLPVFRVPRHMIGRPPDSIIGRHNLKEVVVPYGVFAFSYFHSGECVYGYLWC